MFCFFPQIELALAIRGSYFKYRGGDSQIFLDSFWGGCRVSGRVSPEGLQILTHFGWEAST